jgi:hypothetical protein
MKKLFLTVISVAGAFMLGCVPSVHPLATDKDRVLEPALAGTWAAREGKESFTFKPDESTQTYEVTCVNKDGASGTLKASLVRIGPNLFLDTTVAESGLKNEYMAFHLLPTHLITKITIEGGVLRYATLDHEWLKKAIADRKVHLRHEVVEDLIVLTASTQEQRDFLAKHGSTVEAFQKPVEMPRKR